MTETRDERIARLELRLRDGFAKIGQAMHDGLAVDNWERHWIELLREYEGLEDEIGAHHAERAQVAMPGMPGMPRQEVLV